MAKAHRLSILEMAMLPINVELAQIDCESFLVSERGNCQISGKLGPRMSGNNSKHTPLEWHIGWLYALLFSHFTEKFSFYRNVSGN